MRKKGSTLTQDHKDKVRQGVLAYWAKKRAEKGNINPSVPKRPGRKPGFFRRNSAKLAKQRFLVYRVNSDTEVLIFIGLDGQTLGIEIKGVLGLFNGNCAPKELEALTTRIKELKYPQVETISAFEDEGLARRKEQEEDTVDQIINLDEKRRENYRRF